MPDISMCQNDKCTKKDTCYRYTAKPSVLQSYAGFNQESCEFYIECRTKSQKRRLDLQMEG